MSLIKPAELDNDVDVGALIGEADKYVAAMTINDNYYPVTTSAVHEIVVTSSIHTFLPMLRIIADDPLNILTNKITGGGSDYTLGDGTRIGISLGRSETDPLKLRKFRLSGTPKVTQSNRGSVLKISAMADALRWLREVVTGAYQGTSAEILKELAIESGIGLLAPHDTNDSMIWLPNRKSRAKFAQFIMDHGWRSPESCMLLGMDTERVLRYMDVSEIAQEKAKFSIKYMLEPENKTDLIAQKALVFTSALANLLGGYPTQLAGENVDGQENIFRDVNVVKHGDYLDINQSISKDITLSKSKIFPINVGNVHPYFHEAELQNERHASTFKIFIDVILDSFSGIRLFDVVDFAMNDTINGIKQNNYSGTYFVTARATGIIAGEYFEKIRLATNARNIDSGLLI